MKKHRKTKVLGILLGATVSAQAAPVLVPNGDFEDASSPAALWVSATDEDNANDFFFDEYTFGGANETEPATEPDGDGYVVIDHISPDGFATWTANDGLEIPLGDLGLTAGSVYRFSQDMRFDPLIIEGEAGGTAQIGGLKIEFYRDGSRCGDTGDIFPALIGDGTTWENYTFDVYIPGTVDSIKVVLLWGAASRVAFDNVSVDDEALPPVTAIPNGDFEIASGDSWGLNDDGGAATISFPAAGGAGGGGYGEIDTTSASFGVLVSFSDQVLPIGGLGLTAGETYNFQQQMNLFAGSNIGGLKVEFFSCGNQHSTTGDMFPAASQGSGWNNYDFPVQIPPNADALKVVLLGGFASRVGFDDVTIATTPIAAPPTMGIPNGDFSAGNTNWGTAGEPATSFSFPASGGMPGGYAEMVNDASPGSFGVLIANADSSIPIERLGLSDGNAYTFSMDTFLNSGSDPGKLKVEFFSFGQPFGDSGDILANSVLNTWVNDDFVVSIPSGTDAIRVVPVAGIGSSIRFDNITVDTTPVTVPVLSNLDFEQGNAGWSFFQGGTTSSFPTTGGNPDGHGRIDATVGAWGVLVPNSNATVLLADLGLTAGMNIDIKIDMKIFSGSNLGKVKIEYYSGSAGGQSSGDQTQELPPTLINDGTEWETYTYTDLFVPETIAAGGAVDRIKVVLVHGDDSDVGYDNIEIVIPELAPITITDSGFDGNGNFYIDVAEGVDGLIVTTSPDLVSQFTQAGGVTNDGANRFTISAGSLDANGDGADFFRVEEQ